ncbi:MAG: hypothetical protein O7C59_10070, partial [Rickettsia endosymbiont of Ixodes persulcatus]|nr:hypothetical protein [Rickettsia endosymbiont of Ixodes persulcatus]
EIYTWECEPESWVGGDLKGMKKNCFFAITGVLRRSFFFIVSCVLYIWDCDFVDNKCNFKFNCKNCIFIKL